jgi:hypothetical protein
MESRDQGDKPKPRRRSATVLESVDELLGRPVRDPTIVEAPSPAAAGLEAELPSRSDNVPSAFRPSLRPPMAILCAYDDGSHAGETVRIRVPSFVIGRTAGDLIIPHDGGISGRHAEIARRSVDGRHRWSLRDLGSSNGTFVRAARAAIVDGQELLIGGVRYRFELPGGSPAPRIVEIGPRGNGAAFAIAEPEIWIGRDPRLCAIVLDRPWIGTRQAVIRARRAGRWIIEKGDSGDGVWLRIEEVELGRGGEFQCGEQRFLVRVL